MKCTYACHSPEHEISRRNFLGGMAAGTLGMLGFGGMTTSAAAKELQRQQKRILVIDLHGGSSQLETWDPKPGTDTGGPFRAIPTSVPGIHICELLPFTARQMHHLCLVRGVNTKQDDHGEGHYIMHTGRRREPGFDYPHLGAVAAKLLGPEEQTLPGYIHVSPRGASGFNKDDATFLGPKYASVLLGDGKPPANLFRPDSVSEVTDRQRHELRERVSRRFLSKRRTAQTEAYTQSYDQALKVMRQHDVFNIDKEPSRLADCYGRQEFGRHCLLARRLLEAGVTFVKVTHSNYDTHHENFDFHIEQLGEFDRTFATLIDDLHQRGMLSSTLIIVQAEFGRTPRINHLDGRDHWSGAWSVCLGGCGIKGGTVIGKTNANGTAVTDREVHGGHLFHTYYRALGLDSSKNLWADRRPVPMADPKAAPITEALA